MPSSFSQNGFELQAAGENVNTWGDPRWNNTAKRINWLVAGYQAIAITGDYALTSSNTSTSQADFQAWNAMPKFTGALALPATITVPSIAMRWMIWNATNKALTITTGAGATVTIDPGDRIPVDCDGMACQTLSYGGLALKDYIGAVSASAGAVPGTTGQLGKFLKVTVDGGPPTWQALQTTDFQDYSSFFGRVVALSVAL